VGAQIVPNEDDFASEAAPVVQKNLSEPILKGKRGEPSRFGGAEDGSLVTIGPAAIAVGSLLTVVYILQQNSYSPPPPSYLFPFLKVPV